MDILARLKEMFSLEDYNWRKNIVSEIIYEPNTSCFGLIDCSRIKLGNRDFLQSDLKRLFYKNDASYLEHYILLASYSLVVPASRGALVIRNKIPIGLVEKSKLLKIRKQSEELDINFDEIDKE